MNVEEYRDFCFYFFKEQIFKKGRPCSICECTITEFIEYVVFEADEYSKDKKSVVLEAMALDILALRDKISKEEE